MAHLELYIMFFGVLIGGGAAVGFALGRWALVAPLILAAALAYGWELDRTGLVYAAIAASVAGVGMTLGITLRRRFTGLGPKACSRWRSRSPRSPRRGPALPPGDRWR